MLKIKIKNEHTSIYQLEYAAYMIASSIFRSTHCKNRLVENRLYMYYAELDYNKQYRIEDKLISCFEQELVPCLKSLEINPAEMDVFAVFRRHKEDEKEFTLSFYNKDIVMTIHGQPEKGSKNLLQVYVKRTRTTIQPCADKKEAALMVIKLSV